eukprot:gene15056-31948_t
MHAREDAGLVLRARQPELPVHADQLAQHGKRQQQQKAGGKDQDKRKLVSAQGSCPFTKSWPCGSEPGPPEPHQQMGDNGDGREPNEALDVVLVELLSFIVRQAGNRCPCRHGMLLFNVAVRPSMRPARAPWAAAATCRNVRLTRRFRRGRKVKTGSCELPQAHRLASGVHMRFVDSGLAAFARLALGLVAQPLGRRDLHQHRLVGDQCVQPGLGLVVPRGGQTGDFAARQRGVDLVHVGAQRQDVKKRIEQRVAHLLHQVAGAAVTHEGRAGVAADDGARERCRDVGGLHRPLAAGLGEVHAFVVAAKQDQRHLGAHQLAHRGVVGFLTGLARDSELAGHAHLGFQEVLQANLEDLERVRSIVNELPYFVALPTTSGTGSEVGRSSVVSENDTHLKRVVFSPKILAKTVFADPELTLGLPPHVTAATGMDALTHNIESYLSPAYHPLCDGIALEGTRIAAAALVTAVKDPGNLPARSDMMMSSMMGAIAFQKDLGAVHSCAHALGAVCDLHHGLANALMIDTVMAWNREAVPAKFD